MIDATNGIVFAVVDSLDDPEDLGRVRVRYPHLEDRKSDWARLAAPMAGKDRGLFLRPEVGDEVLVVFVHRDTRFACIVGSLWSKADKPPKDDGKRKDNNWRFLRTRSGHLLKFDDTPGKEQIALEDKDGKRRIVIESAGRKVRVECDEGDISIDAGAGNVTVEAANKVSVKATNVEVTGEAQVKVKAPSIEVKADTSLTLEAGALLTIKGGMVKIN